MIDSPFYFDPDLTPDEFQKVGQLSLRWSHIEHVIGNCLRTMLRLSMKEATAIVFPLSLEQRLSRISSLAKIQSLKIDAIHALDELKWVMPAIQYVRNSVAHAIVSEDNDHGHVFLLRSKDRELTKQQIFESEELTNYAAHAVLSFRYALGFNDGISERHPLPDRPEIPEFLRGLLPTHRKAGQRP